MDTDRVSINRAPVLTLWATIVSERMGYERDTALTLGKAVSGLNAQAKGRSLGIFGPPKEIERTKTPKHTGLGEDCWVTVCTRPVPAKHTDSGLRAVVGEEAIDPRKVQQYLERSFGPDLEAVVAALQDLACSVDPPALERLSYEMYEFFRPTIESGRGGWGQKGTLDLAKVRALAERNRCR